MITLTKVEVEDMIKLLGKIPSEMSAGIYMFLINKLNTIEKQTEVTSIVKNELQDLTP